MARRERHQTCPLLRFAWRVRQRMAAGDLDADLGVLLLAMAEEMTRESPKASGMTRGMQARYLDLYERLESGPGDLMTHSRGVSQLVQLGRSIRLAVGRDGSGRRPGSFIAPAPERQPRNRGQFIPPSRPASGANGGQVEAQHGGTGEGSAQGNVGDVVGVDDEDNGREVEDET